MKCLRTLAHRGPDGEGIYQTEGVFLGHRRLAILDLSERGQQPMSYWEGRYWITFNGEIYNFLEIKKELMTKGHRFQSESDTEVVLASYAEWGEKCLEKFNGMWAFAIWDSEKKELFLSRDRFGKKPLFWFHGRGTFAFASELTALLEHQNCPRDVSVKALQKFFAYALIPAPRSLIEGVWKLPAGHRPQ